MRRKHFLQIGAGAIALFTFDRIRQDASQAQEFRQDRLCPQRLAGQIDRIIGNGITSEVQLLRLLRLNNTHLNLYGDVATIYREESAIEGINHDIAFCQMCLETGFLQFDGDVRPEQNNFGGIGAIGNGERGDSFSDRRIGIRAQIQHLKAYATTQPLIQTLVDPRFNLIKRGTSPLLSQLSGRWAEDINYDKKIMVILRRLYELSGLF